MVARRRSDRSRRRRNLRTPAASSMTERRSSGRASRMASRWPWLMITCCWRPTPVSDRSSWMSSRRHGVPLIEYSESPERNSVRVIVTSARSAESLPELLSMVRETSARPEGRPVGRPHEDDVLHLGRPHRAGTLGTEHPRHGVDDVRLAAAVRAHDDGHARLELEHGRIGEGLESFEGEGLQEHRALTLPAPTPGPPEPLVRPDNVRRSRSHGRRT